MNITNLTRTTFAEAWHTFMKRPWFLAGCTLLLIIISAMSGSIAQNVSDTAPAWTALVIVLLDFFIVQMLVSMSFITMGLKALDQIDTLRFNDLWAPHPFIAYLVAYVIMTIVEVTGFAMYKIPGIIATILLIFMPFLVMNRMLSPIQALKESYRMSSKHFLEVTFLLGAVLCVNVLGAVLLGFGLLVSIPVTVIALARAYHTLSIPDQISV